MTVCPFCKAPVRDAHGPCPSCGKLASDHPSISSIGGRNIGDDFGDDDMADALDLGSASAVGHGGNAAASYDGGGMAFDDDDLLGEGPQSGDLELDVPVKPSGAHSVPDLGPSSSNPSLPAAKISGSHPNAAISGSQPAAARTSLGPASSGKLPSTGPTSAPEMPAEPQPGEVAPPPPPPPPKIVDPAAAAIAKYPDAPPKVWQYPIYTTKVLKRQLELRMDLESLRRRRSPDVPLYERALRTYDKKPFTIGLAILLTAWLLLTVLFFMPVILRFANAPD